MWRGLKCIFVMILASQVILIFVYYALKDNTPTTQWNIGNILQLKNDQKNSTAGDSASLNFSPARFWEMIRLDDGSQEESSTEATSSQKNWSLGSHDGTVGHNTSKKPRQSKPGTINTQIMSTTPTERPENQPFQRIDDKPAWIYSAYFDYVATKQGKPMVLVFGIFGLDLFLDLYCNFGIESINSFQMNGTVKTKHRLSNKHVAGHIECKLPANVRPTHVSVSYQRNSKPTNQLQITYPGTLIRNFTVCYSVLHSNYNQAAQLIQSIEMNRILGADHLVVYNYSVSPAVDQILRRYQEDGLLTVLPWPLPTLEVFYHGQLAAINDCSFRNRNVSRFVVFVDTDEVIIPRSNVTWMELLDTISPQEHDVSAFIHPSDRSSKSLVSTGSFEFRTSFFKIKQTPNWSSLPSEFTFSDEEKNNILKYKLLWLSQFVRNQKVFGRRERTKYISRPELVYVTSIHYVAAFVSKMRAIDVPTNLALAHHYREVASKENVTDTSILKYKNQLYSRFMQQCKQFYSIFT